MVEDKPTLAYWAFRGIGNSCRLALAATGVEVDEKRYESEDLWRNTDKPALDTLLPNLPYLKIGGVVITEHDSIIRIAAYKYKKELLGKNIQENALVEQYFNTLVKLNLPFRVLPFRQPPPTEDELKASVEKFRTAFTACNKRLATNKWIASEDISIADIYLWELVQAVKVHYAPFLDEFDNIKRMEGDFVQQQWYINGVANGRFVEKPMYPPGKASVNNV